MESAGETNVDIVSRDNTFNIIHSLSELLGLVLLDGVELPVSHSVPVDNDVGRPGVVGVEVLDGALQRCDLQRVADCLALRGKESNVYFNLQVYWN